jgi:hypothetical protein
VIARYNRWHFRAAIGQLDRPNLPYRSANGALAALESSSSEALERLVDRDFEALFQDPYRRSYRFQAEDRIDSILWSTLFRAECLADWNTVFEARRRLGRYRLLSGVAGTDHDPAPSFHLLRRGRDVRALESASRRLLRSGPLSGLRSVVHDLAREQWLPVETRGILTLLREGAQLMDDEIAAIVSARVLEEFQLLAHPWLLERNEHLLLELVASCARVGSEDLQDVIARWALNLTLGSTNQLILQSMQQVVQEINWDAVSPEVLSDWFSLSRDGLRSKGDLYPLARATMMGIGNYRVEIVAPILEKALVEDQSLDAGAMLLALGVPLAPAIKEVLRSIAEGALLNLLADAQKGKYGLGAAVDTAVVLAETLMDRESPEEWSTLLRFLGERRVASAHKSGVLRYLTTRAEKLSEQIRAELVRIPRDSLAGTNDPFLMGGREDTVSAFDLLAALYGLTEDEVLDVLIRLSGEASESMRRLAAIGSIWAAARISHETLAALLLVLASDAQVGVRAAAGYALAGRPWNGGSSVHHTIDKRVGELIREDGAEIPGEILNGFGKRLSEGARLKEPQISWVKRLTLHPVHDVRKLAESVLAGNGS